MTSAPPSPHPAPAEPRPHTAGCYPLPIRFLYGTAAEINFWDVVYWRAYQANGTFDTSTEELAQQVGVSRQVLGSLRHEAVEQGDLIEDISWSSGRRFTLQIPGLDQLKRGIIWKPLGYIGNAWQHIVTPAIPKRILNFYLQQPRQSVYHLDASLLADKCKRHFPYGGHHPASPLNSGDVGKALRLLVRLGLLSPEAEGFRIEWGAFNQPAGPDTEVFETTEPRQQPAFRTAARLDPDRAEHALELLDIGHYDFEQHFADIFRDLAYVRPEDNGLLKAKVHRHRNRPPGPHRWRDVWKAFQYELKRRVSEIRAPKTWIDLSEATFGLTRLALEQIEGCVLAIRMVSRVEWPWYFEMEANHNATSGVHMELHMDDRLLFSRVVSPGEAEVRHVIQPTDLMTKKQARAHTLMLQARCDRPLPGLHVEAWLEARLRK